MFSSVRTATTLDAGRFDNVYIGVMRPRNVESLLGTRPIDVYWMDDGHHE